MKELLKKLAQLEARAAAKLAEITDDTPDDRARSIETEHKAILDEITATRAAIDAEADRLEPDPASGRDTGSLDAERIRTAEITEMALRHAMPAGFAAEHIRKGTSIDDVRKLVLEHVAKEAARIRISPHIQVVTDEGDTVRTSMETAILHRANPTAIKLDDGAREFRGMSLMEMGRRFVEDMEGARLRGMSPMETASVLLGLKRAAGMMSTSDFPNILANVVSKRLRSAYETAPSQWKRIARQSNAPDFKERAITQLSNLPQFNLVREGGEYNYAALADSAEKYALATYGRIVALTRQVLINDDLGAFDRIPTLLGRAAAEREAALFWSIITANAAMSDGVALFHATHGNLGSASAIDESGLSAARQAMRKQKGFAAKAADAEPLNVMPKFLIVAPEKETEAQKMLVAVTATKSGDVNVFQGSLELMVEARLTGNAWYLSADPAAIDTIEYAYLEGEEGLYTETRMGFEVDGIEVKGRIDFAAKAIDWRGLYRNPGN